MIKRSIYLLHIMLSFTSCIGMVRADVTNLFREGSFETGMQNIEVYRYPRFAETVAGFRPVDLETEKPIAGNKSLRLPGINRGGYKILPHVFLLNPETKYKLSVDIRATQSVVVKVEVIHQGSKPEVEIFKLKKGDQSVTYHIFTKPKRKKASAVPLRLNLWVSSQADVLVDNISLQGTAFVDPLYSSVNLVSDSAMSVYGINEAANMRVVHEPLNNGKLHYVIRDYISENIVHQAQLAKNATIQLDTSRRGAFFIEVWNGSADSAKSEILKKTSYVVINKDAGDDVSRQRYGIAMEEHGQRSMVDARIHGLDLYSLAKELGAGNVRLFSPAMPGMLSKDGVRYDYSFLDSSIEASLSNGLEPLLVLGSNSLHRIPAWMKSSDLHDNAIDLTEGLRSKKLKQKLKKAKGGEYFDLNIYGRYLKELFVHIDGRVRNYEIWNEPGHKFTPDAYNRIAGLTRSIQRAEQPDAYLLGFSSTGKGSEGAIGAKNPPKNPSFLQAVLNKGGAKYIDALSYHSQHAFKYLGDNFDSRNEETGYVDTIRKTIIAGHVVNNFDIWDTERGIAWRSPDVKRLDRDFGIKNDHENMQTDHLQVARRLPAVHAAAFASNVKKIFWFNMDGSTLNITRVRNRYGFFDSELRPLPHIPVYDAMTEVMGDAVYSRLIETEAGLRAYIFKKKGASLIMLFNWKENKQRITLQAKNSRMQLLDIMGNDINDKDSKVSSRYVIDVDGWPKYIILDGANPDDIKIY